MEPTYSATEAIKVTTTVKGRKKRTFVKTVRALKTVYGLPDDRECFPMSISVAGTSRILVGSYISNSVTRQ
jgi:hypothetical protein